MSKSNLKQKRLEILSEILLKFGAEDAGKYTLTIFETAYNINNTWYARDFITKERHENLLKRDDIPHTLKDGSFCLRDCMISLLHRAIHNAVKESHIKLYEGSNGIEYLVKE